MLLRYILCISLLIFISKAQNNVDSFQKMLKGFFKMSSNVPLTPQRRSNFNARPLNYRLVDRTEYSINKNILGDVFESDMVLTEHQMADVIESFQARVQGRPRRFKRQSIIGEKFRWPNKTIPFEFKDTNVEWQRIIHLGMSKWMRETCIRFVPHTTEKDYVVFFRGGGCYSSVGRTGGKQYISIGYGCEGGGIVAHEIGHAIGFWHEQSRPDRDRYININEDNISKGTKGNFEKRDDIGNLDIPYDFGSVMHYGPQAFTNNWNYVTIETKDHRFQHTIGQRADISFIDVKHANRLYCSDLCSTHLNCENGGYEDAMDCRRCKCPPGLGGTRCQTIAESSPGCGGELMVGPTWQTLSSSKVGNCHWRLFAPVGRIHFEVTEANYKCDSSCADNYLEIKHTQNIEQTGFRQCCNAVPGVIVSESNQVILSSVAQQSPANFTIRFILDQKYIPKPPAAAWEGQGGLTGLLASESGIDNTFENYIVRELPNVIRSSSGGNNFGSFFNIVDSLLRAGKK